MLRQTVGGAEGEEGIMEEDRKEEDLGQAGQMLSLCVDSADYPIWTEVKPPAHIHSCFRDSILSLSLYEDIKNELDLTRFSNIRRAPYDILHCLYLFKKIK